MHPDHREFFTSTRRARLNKSINSLIGLIEGITLDGVVNPSEVSFLNRWLDDHADLLDRHPFNELMPVVQAAVSDGTLSQDERDDILWLCERLTSTEYYDKITSDLQRLHGIVGGLIADSVITEDELRALASWLDDHEHLRTCWPYDEFGSLITSVMADQKIDEQEHAFLKGFFSEFVEILDERTIVSPVIAEGLAMVGLCAVCPEISFEGQTFCFTGSSNRFTRTEFSTLVRSLGGAIAASPSASVTYLIIGAEGNPCWAYSCYGRKVEKAVQLRKAGSRLLLVHESDFHDAVADHR